MSNPADEHKTALLKLRSCAVLQAPNPGPNPVDPNQLSSQPTAAASSQTLSIIFQCRWGGLSTMLFSALGPTSASWLCFECCQPADGGWTSQPTVYVGADQDTAVFPELAHLGQDLSGDLFDHYELQHDRSELQLAADGITRWLTPVVLQGCGPADLDHRL